MWPINSGGIDPYGGNGNGLMDIASRYHRAPAPVAPPPPAPLVPAPRQMSPVPAPMQQGWGGPQGGMSLGDIVNGPQFGRGQAQPQPTQMPALPQMPSPNAPQLNYNQFAQNTMHSLLNGGR